MENVISELGEVGSDAEVFTSLALICLSVFCVFFTIGIYRSSKQVGISTVPALLTLPMPLMMVVAAVFPLKNDLHGTVGPLPLAMNLGAMLTFLLWRKELRLAGVGQTALVAFSFMMLLQLIFVEPINHNYPGLVQRLWYFGWSIWFISLGTSFLHLGISDIKLSV